MERGFKSMLVMVALPLLLTACADMSLERPLPEEAPPPAVSADIIPPSPPDEPQPFPGKIAIITLSAAAGEEEYRSAVEVVQKYGGDKIVHRVWPEDNWAGREEMIEIASGIAADKDVKALIVNRAVWGTCEVLEKLKETRDDVFIVLCEPEEEQSQVAESADLIFSADELAIAESIMRQAHKLGAKTFLYYYYRRHGPPSMFRESMVEECTKLGLDWVEFDAFDSVMHVETDGAGTSYTFDLKLAQSFIAQDIAKKVAQYGKDTAFYAEFLGYEQQTPLLETVLDAGAVLIQPQSLSALYTQGAADYAVRRINGEVSREGLDLTALRQCLEDHAGVRVNTRIYDWKTFPTYWVTEDEFTYPNWILIMEEWSASQPKC